jgi:hypothetical protein
MNTESIRVGDTVRVKSLEECEAINHRFASSISPMEFNRAIRITRVGDGAVRSEQGWNYLLAFLEPPKKPRSLKELR